MGRKRGLDKVDTDEELQAITRGLKRIVRDRTAKLEEAKMELEASEEKLRNLFDSVVDGIGAIDLTAVYAEVNQGLLKIYGCSSPDEVLGKSFFTFVAPRDVERFMVEMQKTIEAESITRVEYTGLRADGSEFPAEAIGSIVKDSSGNAAGFIGIIRDITERKRMEKALQESEERFRSLVENAPYMIIIVDSAGKILFINYTVPGFTVDDTIGTSVFDYIPVAHHNEMHRAIKRAFKTGEPGAFEIAGAGPDSTVSWYSVRIGPIKRDGQIVAATLMTADITERKLMEEELRRSEEQYRDLVEREKDIIYTLDATGNITSANSAVKILRYRPEELIGKNFAELLPTEWLEKTVADFNNLLNTGEITAETALLDKKGEPHFVEYSSTVIEEDGKVVGTRGIVRDITERKRMEKALQESEERFRSLVENAPYMIIIVDSAGKILFINYTVPGFTVDETIGTSVFDYIPVAHHNEMDRAIKRVFKTGEPGAFEITGAGPDSTVAWYSVRIGPIKRDGQIVAATLMTADITERKLMEQALRVKDSAIASSINAVAMADLEGNVTYVNASFLELWGYNNEEEILGKPAEEFWQAGEQAAAVIKALFEKGGWQGELVALRKNGSTFDVQLSASMVTDVAGKPLCMMSSFADITERKRAEERIEHLNNVLHAIRNVNQLVSKENDRDRLLQGACDNLIETRGYHNAWIALIDESLGLVTTAEAGLNEEFLPLVEQLKRSELPACSRRALQQSGVVITEDPSSACADCPLAETYTGRGAMTSRLEHAGKVYGLLSTSVPAQFTADEEEHALFHEVAADIAFALHSIELEEERKRAEEELQQLAHDLNERVKELGCLYGVAELIEKKDFSPEEIAQGTVGLIPPAWQYPEITCARIVLDGQELRTENFKETKWKQAQDIIVHGDRVGTVEVFYIEERPEIDEGPFQKEERSLIDAIARQLGEAIERKRAEEALQESEQKYRVLFESGLDGVLVIDAETMKVVLANQTAAKMYGFDSEEDAIGVNPIDFVHPDDRERALRTIVEDMFEKDLRQVNEFRTITKDGKQRWISAVGTTIEYQGRLAGLVSLSDITERKRAERMVTERTSRLEKAKRELEETASHLNTLQAITGVGLSPMGLDEMLQELLSRLVQGVGTSLGVIWLLDAERGELRARAILRHEGLELSLEEFTLDVVETSFFELFTVPAPVFLGEKDFPSLPVDDKIKKALKDTQIKSLMLVPLTYQGKVIGAACCGWRKRREFTPRERGLFQIIADRAATAIEFHRLNEETHRKSVELEQKNIELVRVNELKSEFLANMSHELRTPMNAIMGYTSLMLRERYGKVTEKQAEALWRVDRNAKNLLSLITNILDLSKIEAGKMPLYNEEVDLGELMEEVISTVEPMVREAKLELETAVAEDIPALWTDRSKLKQTILNLVSNAVKFTEKGEVTVSACGSDGQVKVAVKDTGIGIKEDDLQVIFEEFRQLDGSTTREQGGTGLGLAIAKKFANLLGGDIEVESVYGQGATFTVTIPCSAPPQPPRHIPEPIAEVPARPTTAAKTILTIDDDPEIIALLRENLTDTDYEVVGALSAEDGIKMAAELQPFAITLDILMPHRDGWYVIHKLKSDPKTAHIPVIVISIIEEKHLAYSLGVADYIVKPIERDLLISKLKHLKRVGQGEALVVDNDPKVVNLLRDILQGEGYSVRAASSGRDAISEIEAKPPDYLFLDIEMLEIDGFNVLNHVEKKPYGRDMIVVVTSARNLTPEERDLLSKRASIMMEKSELHKKEAVEELKLALTAAQGKKGVQG